VVVVGQLDEQVALQDTHKQQQSRGVNAADSSDAGGKVNRAPGQVPGMQSCKLAATDQSRAPA
jgi:hypothetical protein